MPVVTDNDDSDSDTVDNLATAEQPESEDVLSQENVEKKKNLVLLIEHLLDCVFTCYCHYMLHYPTRNDQYIYAV